jgi:lysophospholipase L1-like esterase
MASKPRTRLKSAVFAGMAVVISLAAITGGLLALDLYAHHRVERSAGLNWRGYRGPTVGRKQPRELRVAMFGGSTVFGYGVAWDETIPAALERALRAQLPGRPVTVINLGLIGEGAYAFLPSLQDFDDLQFDIVCLYEGYNDLLGDQRPNVDLVRHESTVFRLTGYFPVLPLVIGEKIMALKFGTVDAAYEADRAKQRERAVFHPNAAERTSSAALQAASNLSKALGRQLERLATEEPSTEPSGKSGCPPPWVRYCDFTSAAVEFATSRGDSVIVAAQPQLVSDAGRDRHASQQRALADLAARVFGSNPRVRFVDLSTAIDLSDTAYAFDGMHLTREGNVLIAQALVEPLLALARDRSQ